MLQEQALPRRERVRFLQVRKPADCTTLVTDLTTRIVRQGATATSPELKAWQALVGYLTAFPKDAGVPVVPPAYAAPQARVVSP